MKIENKGKQKNVAVHQFLLTHRHIFYGILLFYHFLPPFPDM